jgi:hypothetical protein
MADKEDVVPGRAGDLLGLACSMLGGLPVDLQTTPQVEWKDLSEAGWEALASQAQAEGLAPLLYWVFSKSGRFSSIPEPVRQALRSSYAGTWMQNQTLLKELETLAGHFHAAGIPLVLLKGACFALTVYPDIGLRPMGDLDVLVPASQLCAAVKIACSLGYQDDLPEASPGLNDLLSHHACLQKAGSPSISLEIHDSLVADKSFIYAVPVDWFWGQTEPLQAARPGLHFKNISILTPAAQVLYAAAHAMLQHGGWNAPLRWIYDLDRLVRFYEGRLDWDLLLSQARALEWGSALSAALTKSTHRFGTPIPAQVMARLSASTDRHQKRVADKQIQPATHTLEERQKMLELNGYARMRLFLALLIPSPAYMRWRYPARSPWLLPFWYLWRWWGILKDGLRSLVSLVHKPAR